MPRADGSLTPEDIQVVRAFLKGKAKTDPHRCLYCDHPEWSMGGHIVLDPIDSNETAMPVVPYIVFFCNNCAYTMRFNAAMMGFYGDETPGGAGQPVTNKPEVRRVQ